MVRLRVGDIFKGGSMELKNMKCDKLKTVAIDRFTTQDLSNDTEKPEYHYVGREKIKKQLVKWFWKIKVPRWMMTKISVSIYNRWKMSFSRKHGYLDCVFLGFIFNRGGDYGIYKNQWGLFFTFVNFSLYVKIKLHGEERGWGINCQWTPEEVEEFNKMPRAAVPFNKTKKGEI